MDTICNSEPALSKLIGDLREAWRLHKYLKVKWTTGKKRSLDQNALAFSWYAQVASELREQSERDKIVRLRRLILRASAVLETVEYDNDPPQRVVDLTNELRSVNREKLGICDAAMIAQQENGNE